MQVRVNFACYYRMRKVWNPETYSRLHIYILHKHPDNVASATQSMLMRAENCIATGEDALNNYCKAGTVY